jgi:flavodoxin
VQGEVVESLIIFGSTRGNTRTVVKRMPSLLDFPVDTRDAKHGLDDASLDDYDLLLFFASTWGDGELQADMEDLLVRTPLRLNGKYYAICELGNYYGYDDFEFGATRIIRHHLELAGGRELVESFSMDSLPRKDWEGLKRWCTEINFTTKSRILARS